MEGCPRSSHGRRGQTGTDGRGSSSGWQRLCPARCAGGPASREKPISALEHFPAPHSCLFLLQILCRAAPLPQPSCAAQACDRRKELLQVLEEDDSLPSCTSPAVLVGRGCGRGWGDGGREGRSATRQELTGVMKKVCLSTQSVPTTSPASLPPSVAPVRRSARPSGQQFSL